MIFLAFITVVCKMYTTVWSILQNHLNLMNSLRKRFLLLLSICSFDKKSTNTRFTYQQAQLQFNIIYIYIFLSIPFFKHNSSQHQLFAVSPSVHLSLAKQAMQEQVLQFQQHGNFYFLWLVDILWSVLGLHSHKHSLHRVQSRLSAGPSTRRNMI